MTPTSTFIFSPTATLARSSRIELHQPPAVAEVGTSRTAAMQQTAGTDLCTHSGYARSAFKGPDAALLVVHARPHLADERRRPGQATGLRGVLRHPDAG